MRWTEVLLLGLLLWSLLGVAGSMVSARRGDRRRVRRNLLLVCGIWGVYLAVLLLVSAAQGSKQMAVGQPQCFDEMCFTVQGTDELEGFWAKGQDRARLVRVRVLVANRGKGKTEGEALLRAYLVDSRGRRWQEVRGLSGVRLTSRVAAGDEVTSQPVFQVGKDATDLCLVLTHGRWQPGVLVIGDPDSWRHGPVLMRLER